MSRFFAQSCPYHILLATLRHEEGVDDNQDKEKDDDELDKGEVVELLEQVGVFVIDVLYYIVRYTDLDGFLGLAEVFDFVRIEFGDVVLWLFDIA